MKTSSSTSHPYGIPKQFNLDFDCNGEVNLEQTYSARFVWNTGKPFKAGPTESVSLRPIATVLATKKMNFDSAFRLVGSEKSWFKEEVEKTFEYPAILEFKVIAEKEH